MKEKSDKVYIPIREKGDVIDMEEVKKSHYDRFQEGIKKMSDALKDGLSYDSRGSKFIPEYLKKNIFMGKDTIL